MGPNPTPCWAAVKGQKKLETKPISVDFPSLGISFIMFHLYVLIFFVGSLLIFGDCFPPQTQHINPFNSSHPSSSMPSIHSLGFIHIDRCSATAQRDRGTLSCSSRCCSSSCLSTSRSSRRFFTWCGKIHVGIEWRTQRTREDVQQKLIELTKNINCSINGDIPEYNRIDITRKMGAFYTNHSMGNTMGI